MKSKNILLIVTLLLLGGPWFIEPAEYSKFCGEVTYQNSTYDKYGKPSYWLELTDPKTKGVREFRVSGSTMSANELGATACFSHRVVKPERLFVFAVLLLSGIALLLVRIFKH